MKFPKYWARGSQDDFFAWRWSDVSFADAEQQARATVQKIVERFRSGAKLNHYGYAERPLREPVIREIRNGNGELVAAVTRNSYGCLVLNTAKIMFVDVDLPELPQPGLLKRLFGGAPKPVADERHLTVVAAAAKWAQQNPGWGWRIYRTAAGVRLLATHGLFEPETAVNDGVFDYLAADPLYRRLCKNQQSFRARLTPKPWRCAMTVPPVQWPWTPPEAESKFKEWDRRYSGKAADWATCNLVAVLGNTAIHPDVNLIIGLHDELTRAESKLPLA